MTPVRAMRLPISLLVACAIFLALAGCGSSHSRFLSHMERGKQYLAAGNLDKANIEFRNALQIDRQDVDALYFSGRVAERRNSVNEAVGFYQAALDAQPDATRARASLAKVFLLGGATQQALAVISPGLLNHPDDPDLLAARAAARHELRDDPDARVDAERAVKLAPANENAVGVLAALALQSGDSARAISIVSDAVTKAPSSVELHQILASVYLSGQRPADAEEQMRKVIALEPNELAPRLVLAAHFVKAEELDEAQHVIEEAVRALPQADGAKLALVDFVVTWRSRERGEKTLRDFIARDPGDGDLRLALGMLLQRSGATQDAIATYRDVVSRDGRGAKGLAARDRIAAIEMSQGHEEAAKKLIAEVLAENARDDDALIMRSDIELEHNDATNAVVDLRSVLHDQPKSAVLQRAIARAYLAKGEPALAEEAIRAALEAAPRDVAVKVELAQFLTSTDRDLQAIKLLEETVHSAPDDAQAREALVHAYIGERDWSAARTAAEELKKLRPDSTEGYYLAGLIAHDEKRFDDSEKNLERALELKPASLDILTTLTRFNLERGQDAQAVARLVHALEHDPKNVPLLDLLGETYFRSKDLAHATEIFKKAEVVDPGSWVAPRDLAQVRLAADDTSGAIASYQTALKIAPTEPQVVTELASLYEKAGRVDEAMACYETLYKRGSGEGDNARQLAANNLAMLLVTYKGDRASLDRASSLTAGFATSGNASFLDTMGWVRFKRKEYREAVISLERAADRSPDSKVIRYHLGMAQLQLGERGNARANLESALTGAGNFAGSEEARSALAALTTTPSTG
jgi:tetratricopeptide (TPR) repeat protein